MNIDFFSVLRVSLKFSQKYVFLAAYKLLHTRGIDSILLYLTFCHGIKKSSGRNRIGRIVEKFLIFFGKNVLLPKVSFLTCTDIIDMLRKSLKSAKDVYYTKSEKAKYKLDVYITHSVTISCELNMFIFAVHTHLVKIAVDMRPGILNLLLGIATGQ